MEIGFLLLAAVLPFLGLLRGQFLYDDFQVILNNAQLGSVKRFRDCFGFVLKPSKPVTNFLLAVGHWLGGGSLFAHRAISLGAHAAVTLLLYANLRLARERWAAPWPSALPFWISLLFAVHPLHSEPMGIVLFRMDILGALFSLAALLCLQLLLREDKRAGRRAACALGIIIALGLAQLSKEVFAFTLPVTLFAFLPREKRWRWGAGIFAIQLVWAGVLWSLLRADARSDYPYREVVGYGVQSLSEQVPLAARALLEGLSKLGTGHDLSLLPPRVRGGLASGIGILAASCVLVIAFFAAVLAWWRGGWWRGWGTAAAAGIFIYLAIPNLNLGSEHYWYFPCAALLSSGVPLVWLALRRLTPRAEAGLWVAVIGLALAWLPALESRLFAMRSRLGLYLTELENHPESVIAWNNVAAALLEKADRESALKAKPFLDQAIGMGPRDPNVLVTEYAYFLRREDLSSAEAQLRLLETLYPSKPRALALFEFHFGLLAERSGSCAKASAALRSAMAIDPSRSELWRKAVSWDRKCSP